LYEKLVGEESKLEGEKKRNRSMKKEKKHTVQKESIGGKVLGDILRDKPGLLVLDEGHTPRNQRSCIWKILSQIQAQKRIILSGTPFQNNFLELYNIL
jgi:DNA repair and recombination RAD54-like protein